MPVRAPAGYTGIVVVDVDTPLELYRDEIRQRPAVKSFWVEKADGSGERELRRGVVHVAFREDEELGTVGVRDGRAVSYRPLLKRFDVPIPLDLVDSPAIDDPALIEGVDRLRNLDALKGRRIVHGDYAIYELYGSRVVGTMRYLQLEDGTLDTPARHRTV